MGADCPPARACVQKSSGGGGSEGDGAAKPRGGKGAPSRSVSKGSQSALYSLANGASSQEAEEGQQQQLQRRQPGSARAAKGEQPKEEPGEEPAAAGDVEMREASHSEEARAAPVPAPAPAPAANGVAAASGSGEQGGHPAGADSSSVDEPRPARARRQQPQPQPQQRAAAEAGEATAAAGAAEKPARPKGKAPRPIRIPKLPMVRQEDGRWYRARLLKDAGDQVSLGESRWAWAGAGAAGPLCFALRAALRSAVCGVHAGRPW